ncbi:N-6 DNA methylase [Nocardia neocaledoniensis]|uniref:N-6 DNA methylase n=1 Tax=Nocardia neocaledoniensis TaxID=236511 RepID=UPI00245646FA|nr:N-6 DNA methylase [Nocardia neocaledoniensis]
MSDGEEVTQPARDQAAALERSARGDAVEYLTTRLFERQQRQQLSTPQGLADLIVELVGPLEGSTVFDPACGSAAVLRTAAQRGAQFVLGQEMDQDLALLAAARLALASAEPGVVAAGDSLRADAHRELRADVVVCDPPFGYRDWGSEDLMIDSRWKYGVPPKTEPELAWLQHCLARCRPGGTIIIVLPAGVAARRAGRSIRKELLRAGALRAVLALPPGVLKSTAIALHVWVLRNPDGSNADPVLLIDTTHLAPPRRGQADWQAISEAISGQWREFRETGKVAAVPGKQGTVEVIDLLGEEVDLTPSRHLPLPAVAFDVTDLQLQSTELAARIQSLAPHLSLQVSASNREEPSSATINDLARAGVLAVRQSPGRPETTADLNSTGPLVLSGSDVETGSPPSARHVVADDSCVELRQGDVVALTSFTAAQPCAEVVDTDGWVLGRNLQLLRPDPDRLDPYFLAGLLRSRALMRHASISSGVYRIDLRRVEIPMLDIGEQRRLGAELRRIHAFEIALRDAVRRAGQLVMNLTDAIADGEVDIRWPGEHDDVLRIRPAADTIGDRNINGEDNNARES